jgi:hypothetical protein
MYSNTDMNTTALRRIYREMSEFDDAIYKTEFSNVTHDAFDQVSVTMLDGTRLTVRRGNNPFRPPRVTCSNPDKEAIIAKCNEDYSPAFTSVKWLLILYTY